MKNSILLVVHFDRIQEGEREIKVFFKTCQFFSNKM